MEEEVSHLFVVGYYEVGYLSTLLDAASGDVFIPTSTHRENGLDAENTAVEH